MAEISQLLAPWVMRFMHKDYVKDEYQLCLGLRPILGLRKLHDYSIQRRANLKNVD